MPVTTPVEVCFCHLQRCSRSRGGNHIWHESLLSPRPGPKDWLQEVLKSICEIIRQVWASHVDGHLGHKCGLHVSRKLGWGSEQISPAVYYWGDRSLEHQDGEPQERGMTRSHKKTENILRHSWAWCPLHFFKTTVIQVSVPSLLLLQLSWGHHTSCTMEPLHSLGFVSPRNCGTKAHCRS